MSTGVKAAAFAAFARIFLSTLEPLKDHWIPMLSAVAGVTMIVGAVAGVVQTNVKRMLAYSSIAHAGYLLLGIVAATTAGKAAILFYLATYAVTNLGALGIVALLGTSQRQHDELRDFSGLWRSRPVLAGLMTVFLLSLGGIPPTAGFIGKWYIFGAAVQEGHYWLAVIGVLNSAISAGYSVRVLIAMYLTPGAEESGRLARQPYLLTSIVVSAVLTVIVGVFPALWMQLARLGFLSL
jgi:NADH-quinone oxidoreductase subunit N